jgi:hypothetical protein
MFVFWVKFWDLSGAYDVVEDALMLVLQPNTTTPMPFAVWNSG